MKQQKEKLNLKLLLGLIVPAAILMLVLVIAMKQNEEPKEDNVTGTIPIPEERPEVLPESKKSVYEQMKERQLKEMQERGEGNKVSESDFFALALGDEPSESEKKNQEDLARESAPVQEKKQESTPKRTTRSVKPVEVKEEPPVVVEVEKPVEEPQRRGGMGIVRAGRAEQPSTKEIVSEDVSMRYFAAIMEESMVIRNNSSVVFLLLEDLDLGDLVIKKNSYLFGKARMQNNVFDVQIEEVKNVDGRLIGVSDRSFYVYDEKYSRGLAHEGNLNEAVKEGMTEGAGDVTREYIGGTGAAALNAIDRTVSNITRKKEVTVSLSKGYKVYIKLDKK